MSKWRVTGQLFFYDWENAVDDPRTSSGKRPLSIEQPDINAVVEADNADEALDKAVDMRLAAAGEFQCYRAGGASQVSEDTPLDDGIPTDSAKKSAEA